jgi:hypothetical protein
MCSGSAIGVPLTYNVAFGYSWTVVENPNFTGESTTIQTISSINNTLSTLSTTLQNLIYVVKN